MNRWWVWSALALGLALANTGCYYEQYMAAERARRTLEQQNAQLQSDLHDAEFQNKQKDTQIDALNKQIEAKDASIASLTAENQGLREAFAKAQEILKAQAGKETGGVIQIQRALPEKLSNALSQLAEKFPDVLEFDPKTGVVRWKADLLFPLGSDKLETAGQVAQALKEFAEIVASVDAEGFDVIVVGHTCNTPIKRAETLAEHKTNWHLSCHRAIAVMNMLAANDVPMTRMGVMGYGEYRPIADNSTTDGKAKNRRVEVYLVPKGVVQSVSENVFEAKGYGLAFFSQYSEVAGG